MRLYRENLAQFAEFLGAEPTLDELTLDGVLRYQKRPGVALDETSGLTTGARVTPWTTLRLRCDDRATGRVRTVKGPLAAIWEIPKPLSVHPVQVDDDTVIMLRRHGNPEGPRLVLSHGNGLASDLYYAFWSLLSRDFDLLVHDLRNHGWNNVGAQADHRVDTFARDHDRIREAIGRRYGEKPTVGVFHSISALACLHAPSRGDGYSALVLFAPPLCNSGSRYRTFESRAKNTADMLRRRTQWFRSREELAELHTYLPYFQRAVPGVFELVARTTLRASAKGQGFELRCPAEFEAQIWDHASTYAVTVDFGSMRCPIKTVAADPAAQDPSDPPFDYGDADVDHEVIPDTTHFLQLEKPRKCAVAVRRFLHQVGILENQLLP